MTWIEPEAWYAQLPAFYSAAAALITAPGTDEVLLVKPTYRTRWSLPGGYVEADEYPHTTCQREIKEELGLSVLPGALLVIDWAPPAGPRPRALMSLTFDCGDLDPNTGVTLQADELKTWGFFTPTEATALLPPTVAPRIEAALRARRTRTTVYLANGHMTT